MKNQELYFWILNKQAESETNLKKVTTSSLNHNKRHSKGKIGIRETSWMGMYKPTAPSVAQVSYWNSQSWKARVQMWFLLLFIITQKLPSNMERQECHLCSRRLKGFLSIRSRQNQKSKTMSDNNHWVSPAHLPQHVILFYTVELARADFSFQGVFKELPTDID